MKIDEKDLLLKISNGDSHAFATLFHHFYRDLVLYAGTYVPEKDSCEDIAQSAFIKLWNERHKAQEIVLIKAFLLKIVQNSCLDWLRHQNIKHKYSDLKAIYDANITQETEEYILFSELQERLEKAMTHLTPIQKECFVMNRMQGIKQAQIAENLGIPLRTVELKIAEALKILKEQLKEYFILIVLFILHG